MPGRLAELRSRLIEFMDFKDIKIGDKVIVGIKKDDTLTCAALSYNTKEVEIIGKYIYNGF